MYRHRVSSSIDPSLARSASVSALAGKNFRNGLGPTSAIESEWKVPRAESYAFSSHIPTSLNEDLYGSARKPRTFSQWEEGAKQNSQAIKQYGSTSPLVWVLVKGKDIPTNAIVAGEEKRHPLYIARTFYEGGLCVGKAGRQLEKGASISYNGHEIHVDTYEVLVPALQPLRYRISESLNMPVIPRMSDYEPSNRKLERLNLIKTVVLIDDSASMAGELWRDACEALAGIVDLNSQFGHEGIDFYFMNDGLSGTNLKEASEVRGLFSSVKPVGETPVGRKLSELFARYLPLVEDKYRQYRPITIIVITDGVPTDDMESVICAAARRLDRGRIPLKQFGVTFAQIGDDPEAAEFLNELDQDLHVKNNCRDIVDAVPFHPSEKQFTIDKLVRIILDAVDKYEAHAGGSALAAPVPRIQTESRFESPRLSDNLQLPTSPQTYERSPRFRTQDLVSRPASAAGIRPNSGYIEDRLAPRSTFGRPGAERFKAVKIAILLDDSTSMAGILWREAREAISGIVEINSGVSPYGIDLFFMNSNKSQTDILNSSDARDLLDSIVPEGPTPAGRKLRTLLDRYLPLLEDAVLNHRPILFLVIADGVPTDDVEGVLLEAAARLDQARVPARHFDIEFVQIGEDREATKFTRYLNEDFSLRNECRSIVHGVTFDPTERRLTTDKLVKIVGSAIDRYLDTRHLGPTGLVPLPGSIRHSTSYGYN